MVNKFTSLPPDSREETKKTSYIEISDKKYRLVYTEAKGPNLTKDILKIEINTNLEEVVYHIHDILEGRMYKRVHLYLKYKYFQELTDRIDDIYEILKSSEYKVNFAFVSKKYKDDDFVLLYDILI